MLPIDAFFRDCLLAIKRIATASRGDVSLEDIRNEAWILAHDSAASGKPLDLTAPADQETLLGKLYGKLVKKMKTSVGLALRLDKEWGHGDDGHGSKLLDTLQASELSDPVLAFESREAPDPLEEARQRSYSQATAYAICLSRWQSIVTLAAYLCITPGTLNNRIRHCKAWVQYQPSMFDGIERITADFAPLPGRQINAIEFATSNNGQLTWEF